MFYAIQFRGAITWSFPVSIEPLFIFFTILVYFPRKELHREVHFSSGTCGIIEAANIARRTETSTSWKEETWNNFWTLEKEEKILERTRIKRLEHIMVYGDTLWEKSPRKQPKERPGISSQTMPGYTCKMQIFLTEHVIIWHVQYCVRPTNSDVWKNARV